MPLGDASILCCKWSNNYNILCKLHVHLSSLPRYSLQIMNLFAITFMVSSIAYIPSGGEHLTQFCVVNIKSLKLHVPACHYNPVLHQLQTRIFCFLSIHLIMFLSTSPRLCPHTSPNRLTTKKRIPFTSLSTERADHGEAAAAPRAFPSKTGSHRPLGALVHLTPRRAKPLRDINSQHSTVMPVLSFHCPQVSGVLEWTSILDVFASGVV